MPFEKGTPKPPGSGRKPGMKNKKRVSKAVELLVELDLNPTTEILKIIPTLEPMEQVEIWLELLSYCESKPKSEPETDPEDDPDEMDVLRDVSEETLLKLIRADKERG